MINISDYDRKNKDNNLEIRNQFSMFVTKVQIRNLVSYKKQNRIISSKWSLHHKTNTTSRFLQKGWN